MKKQSDTYSLVTLLLKVLPLDTLADVQTSYCAPAALPTHCSFLSLSLRLDYRESFCEQDRQHFSCFSTWTFIRNKTSSRRLEAVLSVRLYIPPRCHSVARFPHIFFFPRPINLLSSFLTKCGYLLLPPRSFQLSPRLFSAERRYFRSQP